MSSSGSPSTRRSLRIKRRKTASSHDSGSHGSAHERHDGAFQCETGPPKGPERRSTHVNVAASSAGCSCQLPHFEASESSVHTDHIRTNASQTTASAVEQYNPFSLQRHGDTDPHIDMLPDELLIHIFAHLPPWFFRTCMLVCKRWRSISMHPHLWTNVNLTWLQRPQPCAAELALTTQHLQLITALKRVLGPHTHTLAILDAFVTSDVVKVIQQKCTNLERFRVSPFPSEYAHIRPQPPDVHCDGLDIVDDSQPRASFQPPPSLIELVLQPSAVLFKYRQGPYANLQRLHLGGCADDISVTRWGNPYSEIDIVDLLTSACPELKSLELDFSIRPETFCQLMRRMPRLHQLIVVVDDEVDQAADDDEEHFRGLEEDRPAFMQNLAVQGHRALLQQAAGRQVGPAAAGAFQDGHSSNVSGETDSSSSDRQANIVQDFELKSLRITLFVWQQNLLLAFIFRHCPKLESLEINFDNGLLSGAERGLLSLEHLKQIRLCNLKVPNPRAPEPIVRILRALPGLTKLFLFRCEMIITDGVVDAINDMSSLSSLTITNPLTGSGLGDQGSLTRLRHKLSLRELALEDMGLTFRDASDILSSFPNLTRLSLNNNPQLVGRVVSLVGRLCPQLEDLSLLGCPKLDLLSWPRGRLRYLRRFVAGPHTTNESSYVSIPFLRGMLKGCPNLRYVNWGSSLPPTVTQEDLARVAASYGLPISVFVVGNDHSGRPPCFC